MVQIDVLDILKCFLKRWYILLIGTLLFGLIGFGANLVIPKQYESSSKVYIRGSSSITASLADLQIGSYLSKDYEIIFKSRPVLEKTVRKLNLSMNYQDLGKIVTVDTISDTRILTVSCRTTNADLARDIANYVVTYGIDQINEIDAKKPYIIETAISPKEAASLSAAKMSVIGAVCGLLISAISVFLSYIFNDKISGPEDIENLGLPVFGVIYEDDALSKKADNKEKELQISKNDLDILTKEDKVDSDDKGDSK